MADIATAKRLFAEEGLAFPTIPEELATRLKEKDRWLFSTREIDVSPYDLDHYVTEPQGEEYAVLAHSGHGINSYALQYYLVRGCLRMFLHLGWGGVYMDAKESAINIRDCFSLADKIVSAAGQKARGFPSDGRITIVASDFYGGYWEIRGELHEKKRRSEKPTKVLRQALRWLEASTSR